MWMDLSKIASNVDLLIWQEARQKPRGGSQPKKKKSDKNSDSCDISKLYTLYHLAKTTFLSKLWMLSIDILLESNIFFQENMFDQY